MYFGLVVAKGYVPDNDLTTNKQEFQIIKIFDYIQIIKIRFFRIVKYPLMQLL